MGLHCTHNGSLKVLLRADPPSPWNFVWAKHDMQNARTNKVARIKRVVTLKGVVLICHYKIPTHEINVHVNDNRPALHPKG